jgi:hypothetical protein
MPWPDLRVSLRPSWMHHVAYDALFRVSNHSRSTVYVALWASDGTYRGTPESIEPGGTRLYNIPAEHDGHHTMANFTTTPTPTIDEDRSSAFLARLYARAGSFIEVTDRSPQGARIFRKTR